MGALTRFGIAIPPHLLEQFDRLIACKGYRNRSEAIRDLIRDQLVGVAAEGEQGEMVGTVTFVYNHRVRELSDALTVLQHEHHDAIITALHVHLDAEHCLEVVVLRGPSGALRHIADMLIGTKGVKHGKLTLTTTGQGLP
jgi:CopG family nickel-responsive transcriptional regulator